MSGKSEKNSSFIDAYLAKPKEGKQEVKGRTAKDLESPKRSSHLLDLPKQEEKRRAENNLNSKAQSSHSLGSPKGVEQAEIVRAPAPPAQPSSFETQREMEKREMTEHYTTGNSFDGERTFSFVNWWGQELLMREKKIPLTLKIKKGEKVEEITKTYTFVFSPGGWELWQRRKDLLLEGLQQALPQVEKEDVPIGVIYVILKSSVFLEDPYEEEPYYCIVVGIEPEEDKACADMIDRMEARFEGWMQRELVKHDPKLVDDLIITTAYGSSVEDLYQNICSAL